MIVMYLTIFVIIAKLSMGDANKMNERNHLLEMESRLALGGNMTLTKKESKVNDCLMKYKFAEIDYGFDNPEYFNFSKHYFHYKEKIEDSKVYKIIKDMPKGAALHIHDMGILGPDYLMNLTYMDNLYVCFENEAVKFKFSKVIPQTPCAKWQLMSEARNSSQNIKEFDESIRKHFTLVCDDPEKRYPNINEAWKYFMNYFITVQDLLAYRPIWEQYFYDVLKAFREQNIIYVEVRSVLPKLYELDGTVFDPLITAKAYKKSINRFVKDYPDFIGAKLIYAPVRHCTKNDLKDYLDLARRIKKDIPEHFAGFDLVGQEDLGMPLIDFEPDLRKVKDLDFFFHAGETDWYGTLTDQNLVDAIVLGAKRIGHAYALPKHPLLMKEVIKRDIGIEVNVISNTVLSLVNDVRNHPVSTFIANSLPIVISSDDPGIWEADPISHDYYVTFVGAASKLSDLRLLEALVFNSLKYSSMKGEEKIKAFSRFQDQWNEFVNNFDCAKYD